jgi:hypothetical protein
VKKLAIVLLFVAAACHRQVQVSSTPSSTPGTTPATSGNVAGAATARDALRMFLAAAVAQDVQAMASVWGTAKDGSVRNTQPVDQVEKRAIYMMRCLRHDSYTVQGETPAAGGERVFMVQLKRGTLAPNGLFTITPGPQGRWYVATLDLEAFNSICSAR